MPTINSSGVLIRETRMRVLDEYLIDQMTDMCVQLHNKTK